MMKKIILMGVLGALISTNICLAASYTTKSSTHTGGITPIVTVGGGVSSSSIDKQINYDKDYDFTKIKKIIVEGVEVLPQAMWDFYKPESVAQFPSEIISIYSSKIHNENYKYVLPSENESVDASTAKLYVRILRHSIRKNFLNVYGNCTLELTLQKDGETIMTYRDIRTDDLNSKPHKMRKRMMKIFMEKYDSIYKKLKLSKEN